MNNRHAANFIYYLPLDDVYTVILIPQS